ncbi:GntR family transcriptional regulator [Azospirillum palustre]|uniref:GntR family transcriptional regulator n=1 Tax=Azospirillum palustre TaxID=2044885 RepID=A0A2B8BN42_9PROT|nr:GntR family transcriptional regulator [Azospirillum palustre]PGH58832.1 GntR family transcriptional regulator [Azospirillum palustre]
MTIRTTMEADEASLAGAVAIRIRDMLIAGEFEPGQKLSEHRVAADFAVSRNTLREAFRFLTSQRLLSYIPNRGVFVTVPDEAAIIDIYRVRAVIQRGAVEAASRGHPAFARMRALVEEGRELGARRDWQKVGTNNMEFHRAMVGLCDSPRLSASFDLVLAELRLAFGQLKDTAHLHEPYIDLNHTLLRALETGDRPASVTALDAYLRQSERGVLGALQHRKAAEPVKSPSTPA